MTFSDLVEWALIQLLDLNPHAEIDEVTKKRLTSTGIVTVLIHRVKNIRSRRSKRTAQTTEALPHEVPKLGPVPKEAVKDLGLSHYGRCVCR